MILWKKTRAAAEKKSQFKMKSTMISLDLHKIVSSLKPAVLRVSLYKLWEYMENIKKKHLLISDSLKVIALVCSIMSNKK